MKAYLLLPCVALLAGSLLTGCLSSGPEKTLRTMASALTKKDAALFLAQMEVRNYATSQIFNRTQDHTALRALDSMGRMLGLGSMEQLLDSIVDLESTFREDYTRCVSTGKLMLDCRNAQTPDCPWVPESLEKAKIKELTPTTAVAQVTTPANITSWLALAKRGEQWFVVGQAPLEAQAAQYASELDRGPDPVSQAPAKPEVRPAPKASAAPEKPQEAVRL